MAFQEDPPAGAPEWLVTFGDMMSLLLTFFIMLVSMSELKSEQRVTSAMQSMQKQFGRDRQEAPGALRVRGPKVEAPAGEKPMVQNIRPGDSTMIGGTIYFADDAVEVTEAEKSRFQTAMGMLQGKPQKIEIRGHVSRRVIANEAEAAAAWDLAYRRSRNVMDFLVASGIPAKRVRLSVAGANEPVQLATDGNGPKTNNRVEVFLIGELAETLEGSPEQRAARFTPPLVEPDETMN